MQEVRRIVLIVCLLAGIAAGAAVRAPGKAPHAGKMDGGIIAAILSFFGITDYNKVSIPPG